MSYIQDVHDFVRRIPRRKVTTYGAISLRLSRSLRSRITPRMVGWALHQNKDSKVPCHRVVNKEGKVASAFSFGGPMEQKRKLEAEGISFKDEMCTDLEKCFWRGIL